ncbi:hypothetical protein C9374_009687 [Naegleria lovaniensis]|uniref:Integrator complex subunit 4/Protein SIEL C-terminal Ig-like domain-containing protein n=1 Tax=Naegleria lovaniensis TaxID=51637 RepID=A0AA88GY32_NAELO|nr:uncharacterized protein C9374_009687 [Naegleria lovaniensis]KAG2393110.1 hypothetical protein C9374_009687 [Naegleria lovaniensis]
MKRSFQDYAHNSTFGSNNDDDDDTQPQAVNTSMGSTDIKTAEIDRMEGYVKQLIDSRSSDRKTLLTFLITYFSPTSDNFILNGLSFLQDPSPLLSYLTNIFQYLSTDVGGVDPLYDRDLIALFIRFVASIVSSNVERQDVAKLMEDIDWLSYLLTHESHKIKRQAYNGLIEISTKSSEFAQSIFQVLPPHEKVLCDWDQGIRKNYLELLSITYPLTGGDNKTNTIVEILRSCLYDRDTRVRAQAIDSFIILYRRGMQLSFDLYPEAVNSLHDDTEEVRERGLELITLLAQIYPNRTVTHSGSQLSLVEDAFGKICNAVRDHVVSVRTKACRMLGKLKGVKETLLLEGFGKIELEYTPKYNRKKQQRDEEDANTKKKTIQQKQMIMEQDLSNYEFAEQDVDGEISIKGSEKDALLYSGAVGTFVLALEDQYRSVRMAIIESICELNKQSELFSRKSVDYLIEMFNDEIDSVRIHAIDSVSKISASSLRFDEEQLQIVLAILEDSNSEIRASVRNLLRVIVLSNARCLQSAIRALLINNLRKYRSDIDQIYTCLRDLAKNHSKLTEFLIEELLRLERYIMPTEYKVDDEYYTGLCIAIFSASEENSRIPNHLPKYMYKHYAYLRSKYPNLFPNLTIKTLNMNSNSMAYTFSDHDLSLEKPSKKQKPEVDTMDSNSLVIPFVNAFNQIRLLVLNSEREDPVSAMKTLRSELKKTPKSKDRSLNVFIHFLNIYCACCQNYLSILQALQFKMIGSSIFKNIIQMTYKIEKLFGNLSVNILHQLMCLRLVVYLKYLINSAEKATTIFSNSDHSNIQKMRHLAHSIQKFSNDNNLSLDPSILQIVNHLIENDEVSLVHLSTIQFYPAELSLNDIGQMQLKQCTIISPVSNIEKPIEYQPFISLSIPVQCTMRDVSLENDQLFINVSFPDGTHSIFPIDNLKDISTSSSSGKVTLSKEIQLRTEWWSEACSVDISIASSFVTQIPNEFSLIESSTSDTVITASISQQPSSCLVPLSKGVQLLIHPKLK